MTIDRTIDTKVTLEWVMGGTKQQFFVSVILFFLYIISSTSV